MSSILSCFCVQRRRTFVTRKRNSRKKILTRKSDWSDVSSDLYTPHSSDSISRGQDEDGQILARLLENQHSPRRRHVSDIFRHEPPATTTTPIPNRSVFNGGAEDNMCGYVPKAVGEMSASTALTGATFDDFFSDCRLYPALGKFAKSTDLSDQSASYYTSDRSEDKSSLVTLGTANVYTTTPTHVQIEIGRVETQFDDVIRGNMSSASPSPVPSQADNLENPQQSYVLEIGTPTRYMGSYAKDLENMFACDGDILY